MRLMLLGEKLIAFRDSTGRPAIFDHRCPHRGASLTPAQLRENAEVVHRAWRLSFGHIRHSLRNAFYQGWDLHPAQIPARMAAVYMFFRDGMAQQTERLKNFVASAAQATHVNGAFDDAATGRERQRQERGERETGRH